MGVSKIELFYFLFYQNMVGFNHKKAVQMLSFFAQKEGGTINKTKVFTLIWLSDRLHLRKFGKTILNDIYFAFYIGIIPLNTKDLAENIIFLTETEKKITEYFLEKKGKSNIKAITEPQISVFSDSNLETMQSVYEYFGKLDQSQIIEFIQDYPEWKKFENSLKTGRYSRFEINYLDFFENPEQKNHPLFENDSELLELNKTYFLENQIIANLI